MKGKIGQKIHTWSNVFTDESASNGSEN